MPSDIVKDCSKLIAQNKYRIAFIESATAGRMCAEFSLCDESGKILRGGISCYEVFVKENILKVPEHLIKEFTPESQEVTDALVKQGADFFETDITVAVTGLTTPGGSETAEKPVGTMFVSLSIHKKLYSHRLLLKGSAVDIVLQTIDKTASLIMTSLQQSGVITAVEHK